MAAEIPPDSGEPSSRRSGRINVAEAAIVLLVGRAVRKQALKEDPDAPGMVRTDDHSRAILRRAQALARDGREDNSAIEELRVVAGRSRRSLRRAEKASRLGGRHLEDRFANHVHRLLEAALTDRPIKPVDPAMEERLETLGRVFAKTRSREEMWSALCALEPRLATLEADVRAGRFGVQYEPTPPTSEELSDPDRKRELGENAVASLKLIEEIKRIAGPLSSSPDLVIKSRRAHEVALFYLTTLRPPRPPAAPRRAASGWS